MQFVCFVKVLKSIISRNKHNAPHLAYVVKYLAPNTSCLVQDTWHRALNVSYLQQDAGHRAQNVSHRAPNTSYRVYVTKQSRPNVSYLALNTSHRAQDTGHRALNVSRLAQDASHRAQNSSEINNTRARIFNTASYSSLRGPAKQSPFSYWGIASLRKPSLAMTA